MFGTTDLDNINGLPATPGFDPEGPEGPQPALRPEDLVARAKASIAAASAGGSTGFGGMGLGTTGWGMGFTDAKSSTPPIAAPKSDMARPTGFGLTPEHEAETRSMRLPQANQESQVQEGQAPTAGAPQPRTDDLEEAEAEIKVRVKTGDLLYTRADLIMRRDNHLSAVVDGVLLDLGMISDELMEAMALAHQVHVSATHYMGGSIERRVPLVHH
mgnify:CR=1 FL=1